ncbi:effector-associated domain 2-containing protein [Saccharothrix sp. Mg75]|uniref:effector-associated domain 2-containing protein n=1 Tax=Saccharothrix sp. Mg75 TaxID=3445357 RepID=UPI003EED736B
MGSDALHRCFVVVDVEGYGDPARTSPHRTAAREGMYRVLMTAFAECGLPWDDKSVDDAGDAVLVLLPGEVPKSHLVEQLPERVAANLRRHNHVHSHEAHLRMRMAVHAGEVHYDDRGRTSAEMIFTYRIVDAPSAKRALAGSTATLALVVSDHFYRSVVRHEPAARPGDFAQVGVAVKEVDALVWLRLVDGHPLDAGATGPSRARPAAPTGRPLVPDRLSAAEMGRIVDVLLGTPGFRTPAERDLLMSFLPFAGAINRHPANRTDVMSIVLTSQDYPNGVERLVECARMFAEGSTAMAELETLVADHRPGLDRPLG